MMHAPWMPCQNRSRDNLRRVCRIFSTCSGGAARRAYLDPAPQCRRRISPNRSSSVQERTVHPSCCPSGSSSLRNEPEPGSCDLTPCLLLQWRNLHVHGGVAAHVPLQHDPSPPRSGRRRTHLERLSESATSPLPSLKGSDQPDRTRQSFRCPAVPCIVAYPA